MCGVVGAAEVAGEGRTSTLRSPVGVIEPAAFRAVCDGWPELVPAIHRLVYCADTSEGADVPKDVVTANSSDDHQGRGYGLGERDVRTEHTQPRHLTEPDQRRHLTRKRWVGPAAVVGVLLVLLVPVVVVLAVTRSTPAPGTRSASVSQPARASAAPQPLLSKECRAMLAAANRMTSHADAAVAQLRGHKQLMDDYKSGKIDRATAFPQGSPWRQALARTLKDGTAAADQYDADKATYRKLAAQCSKGG